MQKKELNLIKKYLKQASNIFIVGHKDIDLDAFGAALGIYCYAKHYKKNSSIIIDDKKIEISVKKSIEKYHDINIIKSKDLISLINKESLLVIVDTNKQTLIQNEKLLQIFEKIIIIDHHSINKSTISYPNVKKFIDINASSTCEIITNILRNDKCPIDSNVATTILAGIVLDTNNFIIRTTKNSYYAAYYLTKYGADPKKVQYLLKEDIKKYIEMQKEITEVKVVGNIAISKGLQNHIYRKEEIAKIADTILLFNNIEASFVVAKIDSGIGISARSMGNVNVGEIMEKFGGGGDNHEAAAQVQCKNLNEVVIEIINDAKNI